MRCSFNFGAICLCGEVLVQLDTNESMSTALKEWRESRGDRAKLASTRPPAFLCVQKSMPLIRNTPQKKTFHANVFACAEDGTADRIGVTVFWKQVTARRHLPHPPPPGKVAIWRRGRPPSGRSEVGHKNISVGKTGVSRI